MQDECVCEVAPAAEAVEKTGSVCYAFIKLRKIKMNPLSLLVRIVTRPIHKLEYDPVVQFKFNFAFTWFWFFTIIAAAIKTPKHTPVEITAFLVLEVSLWANFITHLGALGANISAIFSASRQQEIPGLADVYNQEEMFSEDELSDIVAEITE